MPQITRRLEFDAGHRVLYHESKCAFLHGHHYVIEATIHGPTLDMCGRVIDFGVIKQRLGGWIDRYLDHNILLHPEDPLLKMAEMFDLGHFPDVFGGKPPHVMRFGNPTAENIALELFSTAVALFETPLSVLKIVVWETPNCWAEVDKAEYALQIKDKVTTLT